MLDYVGRYTHRIAIANQRLIEVNDGQVRFRYKDYRHNGQHAQKTMVLPVIEFIRRFLQHVLPPLGGQFKTSHWSTLQNRLDEVAGLDRHELTGYSRSG